MQRLGYQTMITRSVAFRLLKRESLATIEMSTLLSPYYSRLAQRLDRLCRHLTLDTNPSGGHTPLEAIAIPVEAVKNC
jgi:hypothetical protein